MICVPVGGGVCKSNMAIWSEKALLLGHLHYMHPQLNISGQDSESLLVMMLCILLW